MYLDSTTALRNLTNPIHTTHMKHIRTKLLYARELFAAGLIIGTHIKGTDNPADQLTKPLSRPQIDHLLFILSKPTWGGESNSRKRKHSDGVTSQKRLRSTAAGYTSATSKHFNADRYDGNLSIGVQRALPY